MRNGSMVRARRCGPRMASLSATQQEQIGTVRSQTTGGAAKTGVRMGSLLVGDPATNAPKPPSATSMHDPEVRSNRDTGRRPWTASLPDEIRASMRSSSKSELPKHYENQLKAYFQTGAGPSKAVSFSCCDQDSPSRSISDPQSLIAPR